MTENCIYNMPWSCDTEYKKEMNGTATTELKIKQLEIHKHNQL